MGNTIRRQPVNFNIPNSPNYKFLNITDFKGLSITDNPFIGDPNTASDLLNVYVDEQNALTTRPRLQKKFDLKESAIIPEEATIISMTHIDNKYLVQYKYEDEVCIFWLIPTEDGYEYQRIEINKSDKCSPIGESKIQIAKYKNYYVFVDGISYKIIDENNVVCNASEKAYVPTSKINKIYGDFSSQGTDFESLNFLTDNHKESFRMSDDIESPVQINLTELLGAPSVSLIGTNYDKQEIEAPQSLADFDKLLFLHSANGSPQSVAASEDLAVQAYVMNGCLFVSTLYGETYYPSATFSQNVVGVGVSADGTILYVLEKTSFGITLTKSNDYGETRGDSINLPESSQIQNGLYKCEISVGSHPDTLQTTFIGIMSTFGAWYSNDNGATFKLVPDYVITSQNATNETQVLCRAYNKQAVFYAKTPGKQIFLTRTPDNGSNWYNIATDVNLTDEDRADIKTIVVRRNGTATALITSTNMIYLYSTEAHSYKRFLDETVDVSDTASVLNEIWYGNGYLWFQTKNYVTTVYDVHVVAGIRKHDSFKTPFNETSSILYGYKNNRNLVSIFSTDGRCYNNYGYARDVDFLVVEKPNIITHTDPTEVNKSKFLLEFNNFLWLGGNKNFIVHSAVTDEDKDNNPLYLPIKNKAYLGNDTNEVTGFNISSDYDMIAYTKNNLWLISRQEVLDGLYDYVYTETRSDNGHDCVGQTIITPLNEYPLQLNNKGFFVYQAIQNVLTSDKTSVLISNNINAKLLTTPNLQDAFFINHLYWTLMFVPDNNKTRVFVLDDRDSTWYYWEFNEKLVSVININDEIELTNEEGRHFTLETSDIINEFNPDVTEYYDDGKKLIEWFWKSQVLHLGTMNYSKKLVDTTFIVADTDKSDEYGLNYAYTAYRKMLSETSPTTITSKLNYVQSTTKRTMIPRFNFLQLKISNVDNDYNNNKLRLIGLGLKYVLLEGLLR